MAKYSAQQLRQMLAKGQAMKNPGGDPSYPIADEEDLGNAIHAVGRGGADSDAIRRYIIGRARAMGKSAMIPDTWSANGSLKTAAASSTRSEPAPYTRSFALEDISIRSGGDGRTVDAYAAIFNTPAEIRDADGEYTEVIDPTCFNRAIGLARRSDGGFNVPVMFNHGLTIHHTPSESGSMPIGVAEEIRPDKRGLFTRSRYNRTQLADEALENIREGSITAYSFAGAFRRSEPDVPPGKFRRSGGRLPTVRRMASTLREYGPTPFPAYDGAEVVGVRAEDLLSSLAPGELDRLATLIRSGTRDDQPHDGTRLDQPGDTGDQLDEHSLRSPRDQLRARYAEFLRARSAS